MPFDTESGLVYSEQVFTASTGRCRCPSRLNLAESDFLNCGHASREGPPSLYATALRRLLKNLDKLDVDSLDTVPATLIDKLWKEITRSHLDELRVWQIFAHTHLGQRTFVHTFSAPSQCSLHSRFDYVLASASSSMRWLTNLTLDDSVSDIDFSKIPKLRNLHNIVVMGTSSRYHGFSDYLLHSWADAAKETGCLNALETIFLSGQQGITVGSLEHLNAFPHLETFCAYDCSLTNKDMEGVTGNEPKHLVGLCLNKTNFGNTTTRKFTKCLGRHLYSATSTTDIACCPEPLRIIPCSI